MREKQALFCFPNSRQITEGSENKNIASTQFYLAGTGAHGATFAEVLTSGFRSKMSTTKLRKTPNRVQSIKVGESPPKAASDG
jgi:hypothetical protein